MMYGNTLSTVSSTYEMKRVFQPSKDYSKVVYKKLPLRHVTGIIYMDEPKMGKYCMECKLYMYSEIHNVGMFYTKQSNPETFEVERLVNRHLSFANYVEDFKLACKTKDIHHFNMLEIEMAKYITPSLLIDMMRKNEEYRRVKAEQRAKQMRNKLREVERGNEKARAKIDDAINTIRTTRGTVENERVSTYSLSDLHVIIDTQSLFCLLAQQYAVDIPSKSLGWINNNLKSVSFLPDGTVGITYDKPVDNNKNPKKSKEYLSAIIAKIQFSEMQEEIDQAC